MSANTMSRRRDVIDLTSEDTPLPAQASRSSRRSRPRRRPLRNQAAASAPRSARSETPPQIRFASNSRLERSRQHRVQYAGEVRRPQNSARDHQGSTARPRARGTSPAATRPEVRQEAVEVPEALMDQDMMDQDSEDMDVEEIVLFPRHVWAQSCPACDDKAALTCDCGFKTDDSTEYPRGWVLVSCREHKTELSERRDTRIVGGRVVCVDSAAIKYQERRGQRSEETRERASSATIECQICSTNSCTYETDCGESVLYACTSVI